MNFFHWFSRRHAKPTGGAEARRQAEKRTRQIDLLAIEVKKVADSMVELRKQDEITERLRHAIRGH